MELSCHLHASVALLPGKEPRYPWNRRFGRSQSRAGLSEEEKNFSHLLGIEPWTIQPVVKSHSGVVNSPGTHLTRIHSRTVAQSAWSVSLFAQSTDSQCGLHVCIIYVLVTNACLGHDPANVGTRTVKKLKFNTVLYYGVCSLSRCCPFCLFHHSGFCLFSTLDKIAVLLHGS
jgi:hypothetical protein